MIETITPEEQAQIEAAREELLKIGLSTARCNRPKAEAAILKSAPGATIAWMQSPKAAVVFGPLACTLLKADPSLAEAMSQYDWGNPLSPAPDWEAKACAHFGKSRPKKLIVTSAKLKEDRVQSSLWLAWWGHCDTLRRVFKGRLTFEPQDDADLTDAFEISKECGWLFPAEGHDVVIATERPTRICMVEGRLHSPDGPAIAWADGFAIYSWRGNVVPADWIENTKNLDPQIALTHENIELRRCAAEIIGWANVLAKLPHKVIDMDKDPMIGKLVEVDLPDAGPTRFLLVRCATQRDFALCVPNTCRTALEANAATNRVPIEVLRKLEVRT
jgi:hypothetical protein